MNGQSKILVIDDDASTLEIIYLVLGSAGYQVETENNTNLMFLENGDFPDLIVLDNNLGPRTGSEICRDLKVNDQVKHIPVILISAMENLPDLAIEAHADDFLLKPFGIQVLLEKIDHLLHRQLPG